MEGLLYEVVEISLGCGAVGHGEGTARNKFRVLVIEQVFYRRDVPVGHPAVTLPLRVCHTSTASARIFIAGAAGEGRGLRDAVDRPVFRRCLHESALYEVLGTP